MKKIRDFKCTQCFLIFEAWVEDEVKKGECSNCGATANRLASAARCFQNTTGKSPSAKG